MRENICSDTKIHRSWTRLVRASFNRHRGFVAPFWSCASRHKNSHNFYYPRFLAIIGTSEVQRIPGVREDLLTRTCYCDLLGVSN